MSQASEQAARAFGIQGGRWDMLKEPCGHTSATLCDGASRIAGSRMSREMKLRLLEKLKDCAVQIAQVEAEAEGRAAACREMTNMLMNEFRSGTPLDDFMGTFNRGAEAAEALPNRPNVRKTKAFEEVEAHISRTSGVEDEDVAAITNPSSQHPKRCPVKGIPIENPYKNKRCGHVMSLEGAIAWLYQKNGMRGTPPTQLSAVPEQLSAACPVVGCNKRMERNTLSRDFHAELTQRQLQSASSRRDTLGPDGIDVIDY